MTTSQSIDSSRDVVKADTDLNKNDVGDDVRISDVKVKQEVEVSVNADPPTLLQTNLSKMDTDGVQQQTNISNVKAGDDTVVVKVEWTYDEDMYDESGIENKRENKPDVHITQLSDKMSNQKAVHVKKSMDCGLESVTMITHENAPSSETKSGSETNESMEVDRKDNVAMTTNISAAQISEARSSGSTPAMESDVTLATTPGLNFTDFIQEVKAGTKASNSVIVEKSTDKVETGNDKAGTVVMTTDSTPIINNVEESIVVVENITSEEIISSESPNSDKNIFLTNVTTENVNNSSMIDSIDLVPEQETVNVENIMSTNPASLVVPGVIETVIEASVSDNTSVSNDTKPEFVTMIILNDSEDNVGHQEVIGNKANQSKSTKPDKDMIRGIQIHYSIPMYTRSLVTHSNEDDYSENNKIYVVEQERKDNEVEEEKPIQKKKKLITARPEGLSVQTLTEY
ncbi:hypothetical protein KUTeg_015394 [Tegillarca granosa]|uniref:Uncharacterized protein n=1 Tax=Tegillarca granosa TaxID=220873 RepID=A0ABQ9EQ67_TEGGR|nr:hypothetical protein KUTeg_015394 [Tegillarca granosa]